MAQGKKSFVAYADWKDIFDELPDEDAGKLIKHIFKYVNDENPETDSVLIKAVFANIKSTLKRDLDKWEKQLKQRSEAGKASAESRKNKSNEINDRSTTVEIRQRNLTDNVNVNVSVNDNENVSSDKKEEIVSEPKKNPAEDLKFRKLKFSNTLQPFLETYGKDFLNEFYSYWTETVNNKSKNRFRQELEKTWDLERRLKTWERNNKKYESTNGKQFTTSAKQPYKFTIDGAMQTLSSDAERKL